QTEVVLEAEGRDRSKWPTADGNRYKYKHMPSTGLVDIKTECVLRRPSGTEAEIQVRVPRASTLVLTDIYYPGWTATVDGTPAVILRVNYLLRAVAVGAGAHVVVFQYRPTPFYLGVWLALAATVGMIAALFLSGRKVSRKLSAGSATSQIAPP